MSGLRKGHQVLDAKGDIGDCQRLGLSRKMTGLKFQPETSTEQLALGIWPEKAGAWPIVRIGAREC